MSDNIASFLKYKVKKEIIDPMYRNINMLSSIFRRNNFQFEMQLLIKLYEVFDLYVQELEKNEWNQKKVSKEIVREINNIINQITYRNKIRKEEFGI
jgi:hypothetical protein